MKYLGIFFLLLFSSFLLFILIGMFVMGGGDPAEEVIIIMGTILIFLMSFLITQMIYITDILMKRNGTCNRNESYNDK
ncbi:hypothetical protein A9C19_13215 [Bacillus weihaiensis]|uniref:Uncharacterized protein n=2 Tax=Bacillus weihaiensis TaxID=1547283 RepID=A0A1L3MXP9_9BACI|nr:hypothetical protein A9C19_13215 [Bacillus weihaiensis]